MQTMQQSDSGGAPREGDGVLRPTPTTDLLADLAAAIAQYRGNTFRYLTMLLRDPDARDADIARTLGLAPNTPYDWCYQRPELRQLRDHIRASAADLRTTYAKAAMLAAVPDVVDTMITVAQDPKARDGQRARERILEETGVLQRAGEQAAADAGAARATLALLIEALREAEGRERERDHQEGQRVIIDLPVAEAEHNESS